MAEVMCATDTSALAQRIYTQLSGGEKQRVQLARVFAQIWRGESGEPRLLLLDEPTTALDLAHQQLIMETLGTLAKTGCAVAMVAHDFHLITAIADQVTALRDGKQIAHGRPCDVLSAQVFSSVFGVEVSVTAHPKTGRPVIIAL